MKIRFIDDSQSNLLSIERRWVFILSKYTVHDNNGMLLAVIKQKFRIGTSYFEVYGPEEEVLFTCSNKPFHWWTFNVESSIGESAMILKKWSGGKEILTDADNFQIDFGTIRENIRKQIILALALAIDTTVFERKKN